MISTLRNEAHPSRAVSLKWKLLPVWCWVDCLFAWWWYLLWGVTKKSTTPQKPKISKNAQFDNIRQNTSKTYPFLYNTSTSPALQPWPSWGRGVATTPSAPAHAKKKQRFLLSSYSRESSLRIPFMHSNLQGQGVDHGSCLVHNFTSQHLIQGCGIRPFLGKSKLPIPKSWLLVGVGVLRMRLGQVSSPTKFSSLAVRATSCDMRCIKSASLDQPAGACWVK